MEIDSHYSSFDAPTDFQGFRDREDKLSPWAWGKVPRKVSCDAFFDRPGKFLWVFLYPQHLVQPLLSALHYYLH